MRESQRGHNGRVVVRRRRGRGRERRSRCFPPEHDKKLSTYAPTKAATFSWLADKTTRSRSVSNASCARRREKASLTNESGVA